jgi:uncharacterized DUF497 family protein
VRFDGFDWDDGNRGKNEALHNVSDEEAEDILLGDPVLRVSGRRGSPERRYIAYGQTEDGDYLVVVFTTRRRLARVISARPMNDAEERYYRSHRGQRPGA